MHSRISWPVNGKYECFECGLTWPVAWEQPEACSATPETQCGGLLDGAGAVEISR
jgi:hypothetical protein